MCDFEALGAEYMEMKQLVEYMRENVPEHLNNMCGALELFSEEMEAANGDIISLTTTAQCNSNFAVAKKSLEAQEELSHMMASIQKLLALLRSNENAPDALSVDASMTPVRNRKPSEFSLNGKIYKTASWRALLIKLCELLYEEDASIMEGVVQEIQQRGKRGPKLSKNPNDLHLASRIGDSDIWVETYINADQIRRLCLDLLKEYGIPSDCFTISLR